jgi:hypothetical protein
MSGRDPWSDYRDEFAPQDRARLLWMADQLEMHLNTLEYAAALRRLPRLVAIIAAAGMAAGAYASASGWLGGIQ